MGGAYSDGKIMAAALLLGPVLGVLIPILGAFLLLLILKVPFRQADGVFVPQTFYPPLPLKRILLRPVFGRKRIRAWFKEGILRGYARGWNALANRLLRFSQLFSTGKINWTTTFGYLNQAFLPLVWAGVLKIVELAFSQGVSSVFNLDVWFLLQSLLVGIAVWRWGVLAQKAFLGRKGSFILGILVFLVAFGLISLLFWAIFAVPLVAS